MNARAAVVLVVLLAACSPQGEDGSHPATSIGRAEVTEAVMLMSAARTPVLQHYQMTGRWPTDRELERMVPVAGGGAASNLRVGDGTELLMDVGGYAGGTVSMRYDAGSGGWTCRAFDIPAAALPANCRN